MQIFFFPFFFLRMCLSLYDYQSKASRHKKGLTYSKNRTSIQKHTGSWEAAYGWKGPEVGSGHIGGPDLWGEGW